MIKNILAAVLADERFARNDKFERNSRRSIGSSPAAPAITFTPAVR